MKRIIYGSDYDFPIHPVIRIDMSGVSSKNPDMLNSTIEEK